MATRDNEHLSLIRNDGEPLCKRTKYNSNDDGEPLCKRTKYNSNDVCIDLKSLISHDKEITGQRTESTNSLSTQNEDAGDSGFQEFTSNDSPSSKDTTDDESTGQPTKQTTFSGDHQFIQLNHFNQESHETADDDLNNIQLQNLNDNEDSGSIISDISCLSSMSDMEDAEKWQSNFGPVSWVQQQITSGTNPRQIIDDLLPNNFIPTWNPSNKFGNMFLWKFIMNILSEPPKRKKLDHVNNIDDVVSLIKRSKKIVVLTGAGISVSSGIPDFRSREGIYARLSVDFPDLPDPQAMFCINFFKKDQRPFYKFAKEIYPGQFKPSISHKFIKLIESNGKLLRNYTQNIDTLEKLANIERVITCHGSFSTASCTNCKYQVDGSFVKDDIFAQRIPRCPKCPQNTDSLCVLKPDIVFFGESLPEEFHDAMARDKEECDLLIVIGSSLKVRPVALIPTSIPADVPQILINRENLPHMTFDVELLGDCDVIIQELCHRLGDDWNSICVNEKLNEVKDCNLNDLSNKMRNVNDGRQTDNSNLSDDTPTDSKIQCFGDLLPEDSYICIPPSRYLFKGAEVYSDSDNDSDEDSNDDEDFNSQDNPNAIDHSPSDRVNYHRLDDFNHESSNGLQEQSKSNQFNSSVPSSIDTNNNS